MNGISLKKLPLFLTILPLLLISSCGGTSKTKLTSEGKEVRVLELKPRTGCDVVAKVVGINDEGSVALARNHARNLAGDKGADSITFDEEVQNGSSWKVHSTAWNCE